jgi:hypothetical protein
MLKRLIPFEMTEREPTAKAKANTEILRYAQNDGGESGAGHFVAIACFSS